MAYSVHPYFLEPSIWEAIQHMSPPSDKLKERFSVFSLFIDLLHRLQKDERLCEPRPVRSPESNYEPVTR